MRTELFDEHGILLRRDAIVMGLDDNWLARMVRAGEIVRMRQGAYAKADVWAAADRAGRHVLLGRAVMQQYDDRVALSHASAHVRRGGPDYGLGLDRVNITNLFARGDRVQAGITHHRGECRVNDVTRIDGHWITAGARTAIDTAAAAPRDAAVCVLDWSLNQGLARREVYDRYTDEFMREWPDTVELPRAVALCDGRRESVGETRTGLLLNDHGLLDAEPQWEVSHPSGRLAGIVDSALHREGVMIEFDGLIKYGRLLKPGQTISDVIMAERAREKLIEELTGYWMIRLIWADLENGAATADRIRAVIARAAQRRAS
jgi:hypothetical protein